MNAGLLILVILAGVLNTIQSGSNATLHKVLARPLWSTAIVFAVGLVAVVAAAALSGERLPDGAHFARTPWWALIGGLFGALYIVSMMLAADKMGAAIFMGLTVTLAVITSLVMDHYGLMGFDMHRAGAGRWIGGALMIAGLGLIARY